LSLSNNSTGTTEDVTYQWKITGPENLSIGDSIQDIAINTAGFYDIQLIASYDNCVDTLIQTDKYEVVENPVVSFDITADKLCENVAVTLDNTSTTATGEFVEWSWDFGDGNSSEDFEPTHNFEGVEGQTITLTGITSKGCESTNTQSFEVSPNAIASLGDDVSICVGSQIDLEGSVQNINDGGSFFWQENPDLSCTDCLTPTASPSVSTAYVLFAVHANGCESTDTINVTIVQNPEITLAVSSDTVCLGASTTLSILDYDDSLDYQWDASVDGMDCYENCASSEISPIHPSLYKVTVSNDLGCQDTSSIFISVESKVEEFLLDTAGTCQNQSIDLSIIGGLNPQWEANPDLSCTDCREVVATPSSTQHFYATVESALGCTYRDSIEVKVIPTASIDMQAETDICLGEELVISAMGIGTPQWTPNALFTSGSGLQPEITLAESQYVHLTMIYDQCELKDSIFINVHEKAEIFSSNDSICIGEEAFITAEGRAEQYTWQVADQSGNNPDLYVSPESTTIYEVIGQYRTCEPDTSYSEILVYPGIQYSLPSTTFDMHYNEDVLINPLFNDSIPYTFAWTPSLGLSCSDCPEPTISNLDESQEYSLYIEDPSTPCAEEWDIEVRFINDCLGHEFYVPNVITPESASNNIFKISTKNPEEFIKIELFDRWGNFVFGTEDVYEGWDGTYNGDFVKPGVYVYKLTLVCPLTDEEYIVFGDVTAVR